MYTIGITKTHYSCSITVSMILDLPKYLCIDANMGANIYNLVREPEQNELIMAGGVGFYLNNSI